MGRDDKLVDKAVQAAEEHHPDFIALLGSPVPAIIGTDFPGIAREVEARTGIPTLGFSTTGFSTYDRGVEMALSALIRRFTRPPERPVPNGVTILGLTPLDFGAGGNDGAIRDALAARGFSVVSSLAMGTCLEQVRRAASAQVSLVVSRSGLRAARELEQRWGIPYVAGVPIDSRCADRVAELLRDALRDGKSRVLRDTQQAPSSPDRHPLLLVGDQVMADPLRAALLLNGDPRPLSVASFFGLDPALTAPGDLALEGEAHLLRLLKAGQFQGAIADPLITHLPPLQWRWRTDLPHPAVSSCLHWDQVPLLTGERMDQALCRWAAERP
nr:nitrogenase component 1 [Pseudoflavonifractor sp. MSJ-37]